MIPQRRDECLLDLDRNQELNTPPISFPVTGSFRKIPFQTGGAYQDFSATLTSRSRKRTAPLLEEFRDVALFHDRPSRCHKKKGERLLHSEMGGFH